MAEKNRSAFTDRNGEIFLLVEINPRFWMVKSANKISNGGHRVLAVGQEKYVRNKWKEFVENEKRQIATNYDAVAAFGLRQQRA